MTPGDKERANMDSLHVKDAMKMMPAPVEITPELKGRVNSWCEVHPDDSFEEIAQRFGITRQQAFAIYTDRLFGA